MSPKKLLLLLLFVVAASVASAQNSKDVGDPLLKADQQAVEQYHQRDAYTHHKVKAFKWKRQNVKHTAQYEFYKRVELAAKEHQRELKKLHKPQYSDFLYYGHKRKPKKHAAGKLQYCKECGIRH